MYKINGQLMHDAVSPYPTVYPTSWPHGLLAHLLHTYSANSGRPQHTRDPAKTAWTGSQYWQRPIRPLPPQWKRCQYWFGSTDRFRLQRRSVGGGNTSVPCSTDPPLWTPLCSTRSHGNLWSQASTSPPTTDEVLKAIKQTSSGRSPGIDGISAEIFKSVGPVALEALHSLLTCIWEEEGVPKEFRNATVVSLFKNRGSKTDCSNYHGISLLSIVGKIGLDHHQAPHHQHLGG